MPLLGTMAIGDTITIKHKNSDKAVRIVHRSGNNTYLMFTTVENVGIFGIPYANCSAHTNMNSETGFLAQLDARLVPLLQSVSIQVAAPGTSTEENPVPAAIFSYITAKVFALSAQEIGVTTEDWWNISTEGSNFSYFYSGYGGTADARRKLSTYWRTRSFERNNNAPLTVQTDGRLTSISYYASNTTAPVFVLPNSTPIENGTILYNQPPPAPAFIQYENPKAGKQMALACGAVTDPDNDPVLYKWERRIDGGAWESQGDTSAPETSVTVPVTGVTVAYRVKASDDKGAESAYVTGDALSINYNDPPVVSGANGDLGVLLSPVLYNYSVTDAQASTQTLTVTETIQTGENARVLRVYTAVSGAQQTADASAVWRELAPGAHVLRVAVSDGAGGEAVREMAFSRSVPRVALSRAVATDEPVTKCLLSFYPLVPYGADFVCEVCNNPFDASPAWEDVSGKIDRLVHTFANAVITSGPGVAYRFSLAPAAGQSVEVRQITVRFA